MDSGRTATTLQAQVARNVPRACVQICMLEEHILFRGIACQLPLWLDPPKPFRPNLADCHCGPSKFAWIRGYTVRKSQWSVSLLLECSGTDSSKLVGLVSLFHDCIDLWRSRHTDSDILSITSLSQRTRLYLPERKVVI